MKKNQSQNKKIYNKEKPKIFFDIKPIKPQRLHIKSQDSLSETRQPIFNYGKVYWAKSFDIFDSKKLAAKIKKRVGEEKQIPSNPRDKPAYRAGRLGTRVYFSQVEQKLTKQRTRQETNLTKKQAIKFHLAKYSYSQMEGLLLEKTKKMTQVNLKNNPRDDSSTWLGTRLGTELGTSPRDKLGTTSIIKLSDRLDFDQHSLAELGIIKRTKTSKRLWIASISLILFGFIFFAITSGWFGKTFPTGKILGVATSIYQQIKKGDGVKTSGLRDDPSSWLGARLGTSFIALGIKNFPELWENKEEIKDALGYNYPRKYLLIFQNSQEARAGGGFIGSYGMVKFSKGDIEEIFMDDVYNIDGQLVEKIVPPKPIQKISAAWSMHDANWFADFPTSARLIALFYEKAGGETVDGVIALDQTVMEKILTITGPIEMNKYSLNVTADNFVNLAQYKVEVDYDKEKGRPKQFLKDLMPLVLEKISKISTSQQGEFIKTLIESLDQKHIQIFSVQEGFQNFISGRGWSGEILESEKDYLAVINSNINGYKTDGVIEQEINHLAEIQEDGTIIDSLTITRRHFGGDSEFDWYNRVNADYLRVYLPKGSELLEARGYTQEKPFIKDPQIDYSKFKKDPLVDAIENSTIIDPRSGTQIFDESGKTVFANWVYVSPGESATLYYKYLLPFKIDFKKAFENYSLLVQKQAGSAGSKFSSTLIFPRSWQVLWKYPENLSIKTLTKNSLSQQVLFNYNLVTDKYYGVVFEAGK